LNSKGKNFEKKRNTISPHLVLRHLDISRLPTALNDIVSEADKKL
jgi:hypothetical protein